MHLYTTALLNWLRNHTAKSGERKNRIERTHIIYLLPVYLFWKRLIWVAYVHKYPPTHRRATPTFLYILKHLSILGLWSSEWNSFFNFSVAQKNIFDVNLMQ